MAIDWEAVVQEGEKPAVDFKQPMAWDASCRVSLMKDIIAMSNMRDGGILLFGPSQDQATGTFVLRDVSPAQLATFDPTPILEFVNRRVAPPVQLRIEKPVVQARQLVAIVISEFAESPTIATLDTPPDNAAPGTPPAILPGQIFVRTAACQTTVLRAESDMRDLLNHALAKRTDQLLHRIRAVMEGSPQAPAPERGAPHQDAYASFRADANSLIQRFGPRGWWMFQVIPDSAVAARPFEPEELQALVHQSVVSLRGWDFPHVDREGIRNRADGVASETHWDARSHHEMWRASYEGFFGLIHSCWEDHYLEQDGKVLWFLSAIYTVMEFVQFAKRFYEAAGYTGGLELRFWLGGMKDRVLGSPADAQPRLHNRYVCDEDVIQRSFRTDVIALQSGWEEQTIGIVRWLFAMFNWNNPDREMIRNHIASLMSRRV